MYALRIRNFHRATFMSDNLNSFSAICVDCSRVHMCVCRNYIENIIETTIVKQ